MELSNNGSKFVRLKRTVKLIQKHNRCHGRDKGDDLATLAKIGSFLNTYNIFYEF